MDTIQLSTILGLQHLVHCAYDAVFLMPFYRRVSDVIHQTAIFRQVKPNLIQEIQFDVEMIS
ncbi:hypothetical protein ABIA69_000097 [Lysinibacillus parviboronicapiens]|uniref:Uncharacterized protein n=1 Tax=Lysinibacillus parviboronicapiens TaxID=436516 RepID=A0ABV2PDR9_9BACI|nr:hypothetical protein [Lysinibacillus parviboronicapiens]